MTHGGEWLKVREAADRARCGPKTIYRAVRSGQLRAARIGGRRELRFLDSWVDAWLLGQEVFRPALIEIADNRVYELHHHQQGR
jgi:excisionase family DNA binding protein